MFHQGNIFFLIRCKADVFKFVRVIQFDPYKLCIVHLFAVISFTKLHIYLVSNKSKNTRNKNTDRMVTLEKAKDHYRAVQKRIESIGLAKSPKVHKRRNEKSILTRCHLHR